MSFEIFYNFFFNVTNRNVKNFWGSVERARFQKSKDRTFGINNRFTLFNSSGNKTINKGFLFSQSDVLNPVNDNTPKNNSLLYLIAYSQLLSELLTLVDKYNAMKGRGNGDAAPIRVTKNFKIGTKTIRIRFNLKNSSDFNTLLSMGNMSFNDAKAKFFKNGKLVIGDRVVE